jgi:hypothetical protein
MRAYVDADVLIWHLRGDVRAARLLKDLRDGGRDELWIGAMQRVEVLFFMRTGEETATEVLLSQFQTAPVDQATVDLAGQYYRRWHPSHGIDANDALLAAAAVLTDGRIVCLNLKHYPMPDVRVAKAW